ncbi:hypothetical protein [Streptomyces virginiae]|uniref:hypothetical protein n=1 Tax=Streptomyces virginiae TaxID=1961 RepID=UPI000526394C|nr:hypothetical protein [Streptomyces virginiae]
MQQPAADRHAYTGRRPYRATARTAARSGRSLFALRESSAAGLRCIRHHRQLSPHIVTTPTRTDYPTPLDTITTDPATTLDTLVALYGRFPRTSHRLATILTRRYRALAEANPNLFGPALQESLDMTAWLEGLEP